MRGLSAHYAARRALRNFVASETAHAALRWHGGFESPETHHAEARREAHDQRRRPLAGRQPRRPLALTNDAVQKRCEDYGKFEPGNKLSFNTIINLHQLLSVLTLTCRGWPD